MAELIAQGARSQQMRRRLLRVGQTFVLGRQSEGWSVPWDEHISRRHAELCFQQGLLSVKRLGEAQNPIFLAGDARNEFKLHPGEHFVIGETTFTLVGDRPREVNEAQPTEQLTFSPQSLKDLRFRNPDQRLEVLSRLPKVISSSADEAELFEGIVNMLLAGIRRATAAAMVKLHTTDTGQAPRRISALGPPAQHGGRFSSQPAVGVRGRRPWAKRAARVGRQVGSHGPDLHHGRKRGLGLLHAGARRCLRRLGTYLAGHTTSEELLAGPRLRDEDDERSRDLREDVKFAELVAATISSLEQVQMLQRQQASLSQFFAPAVLKALATGDPEKVLAPRETEVSVLFCDLRGFSLKSEHHADNLLGLLNRVSGALGVMTHHILLEGGVFGDFQGDAAMGFWGWPLAQQDEIKRACLAALGITRDFEAASRQPGNPLPTFAWALA